MKRLVLQSKRFFLMMSLCLVAISCGSSNDNYPQNYVGFKRSLLEMSVGNMRTEVEAEIQIIAVKKADHDRTLVLTPPAPFHGQVPFFELSDERVTIQAGEKSASVTIKVFPKQMILKTQNIAVTCTPQWKGGEISRLTIKLKKE